MPVARGLMNSVDKMLELYSRLANFADADDLLLWNVTPKFHYVWHWSRRAVFLNPRRSNCRIDEDFVGLVKVCVSSCCEGTSMTEVPVKVMEKMEWIFHLRLVEGHQQR